MSRRIHLESEGRNAMRDHADPQLPSSQNPRFQFQQLRRQLLHLIVATETTRRSAHKVDAEIARSARLAL